MIAERLTFQAKYGMGDELVRLFREMAPRLREAGVGPARVYTDATGQMFTVQVEAEYADWNAYAAAMTAEQKMYAEADFQEWFRKMTAVTERGERQLLNVETV